MPSLDKLAMHLEVRINLLFTNLLAIFLGNTLVSGATCKERTDSGIVSAAILRAAFLLRSDFRASSINGRGLG